MNKMILKWKDSTEFKNYEKMVGILYDAGIVSRDQLCESKIA